MSAPGGAAGGAPPFGWAASAKRAGPSSQRAAGFFRRHSPMSASTAPRACAGVGVSPSRTPGISVVVVTPHGATSRLPLGDGGASWRGAPVVRDCASTMPPRASGSTASTISVFGVIASPPLERGQLRARRRVVLAARREVARAHRDRVAVPEIVELVDEPALEHVDRAIATAVELVEGIGAVHLDGELGQTLGRVRPRPRRREHAVKLDVVDAVA